MPPGMRGMISRAARPHGPGMLGLYALVATGRLRRPPLSLRMSLALRHAFLGVFFLHTLTVLWVWRSWGGFGRSTVMIWMDFPASLVFLQLTGRELLLGSFLLGGLQWGLIGLALTYFLGRAARRGRPAPPEGPADR